VARRLEVCVAVAALLSCVAVSEPAAAHDPFEITTQGSIRSDSLILVVVMAQTSAQRLIERETGRSGPLNAETLQRDQARLAGAAARFHELTAAGRPLRARGAVVTLTAENDVEFQITYDRPGAGPLRLHAKYLERLTDGYGNGVNLSQVEPPHHFGLRFLSRDNPTLDVQVLGNLGPERERQQLTGSGLNEVRRFFALGMHHLFTGYDHLLFLAALLLSTSGLAAMVAIVTAFTVAHSVTLAISTLDSFAVPNAVVEPLIAASIMAVALENLLFPAARPWRRLVVTLGFGLIHGFGFAGVLRELGLGGDGLNTAARLLAFNLGIEVAQLLLAVPVALALTALRRRGLLDVRALRAASVAIGLLGGYWFLQRVMTA
jgi:hydrogenase/urease accessory protein HupE